MLKTVKIAEQFEPIFKKAQEYVSTYFGKKKEDPSRGTIEISGERYILVRAASMSVDFFETIKKLYEKGNEEEALNITRQLLFDIAHAIGKQDAKYFHNKMNLKDPIDKLSAGPVHFSHSGWAFVDIFPESRPSPDDNYYLIYDHPYSFESSAWLEAGKRSDFPVCIMNAGYSSGWCEESFGITLVASEILCQAKGDPCCRFIMAPPSKIEHHIADYIKKDPRLAKKITHYEVPDFFKRKEIEDALRESELKFRSIFDNAMVGMILIDLQNNKFIDSNNMICQMLGYSPEELGNLGVMDIYPEMSRPHVMEKLEGLTRGKSTQLEDLPLIRKDRTVLYSVVDFAPLTLSGKNYITGLFRDITLRKEMERSSQENEEKFRLICTMAKDAIIMMDDNGSVTFLNSMAEEMFGYAAEDVVGKELHAVLAPEKYREAYRQGMETFKATGLGNAVGKTTELVGLKKGGIEIPVELSLSAVRIKGKWTAIGTVRDITNRKDTEAKLKDLSNRDELTGLYNRRGFIELIEQQAKVAERMKFGMHLLFGDLDYLKEINDKFGHQEGDRALIEIANILTETFRTSDIVARIGGDEFVALALKTQEEHAEILESRLNKSISARNTKGDLPYTLSLSIGIAYYAPEQAISIENLIAEGDRLMYEAKKNKKNNE